MSYPHSVPQPGPRPVPTPGGFRPGPAPPGAQPGGFRPGPPPAGAQAGFRPEAPPVYREPVERRIVEETGHPAVDAVLRSLANAAQLAPAEQIAAYEAAHQVLQETLSGIEG